MSASKIIIRNLTATVAVLLAVLIAYSTIFVNHGTVVAGPKPGEDIGQENLNTQYQDDLGDLLDGVFIDYCA